MPWSIRPHAIHHRWTQLHIPSTWSQTHLLGPLSAPTPLDLSSEQRQCPQASRLPCSESKQMTNLTICYCWNRWMHSSGILSNSDTWLLLADLSRSHLQRRSLHSGNCSPIYPVSSLAIAMDVDIFQLSKLAEISFQIRLQIRRKKWVHNEHTHTCHAKLFSSCLQGPRNCTLYTQMHLEQGKVFSMNRWAFTLNNGQVIAYHHDVSPRCF